MLLLCHVKADLKLRGFENRRHRVRPAPVCLRSELVLRVTGNVQRIVLSCDLLLQTRDSLLHQLTPLLFARQLKSQRRLGLLELALSLFHFLVPA